MFLYGTITIPLIAAALIWLLPLSGRLKSWLTVLVCSWELIWSCHLFNLILNSPLKELITYFNWLDLGEGFNLNLSLRLYSFNSFLLVFISLFTFLVVLYSLKFMKDHPRQGWYYSLILLTLGAASGIVLADNFIFFLVFWELATLALFLLVSLGRAGAAAASLKTFIILGLTDGLLLLGVIFYWLAGGSLSMSAAPLPLMGTIAGLAFLGMLAAALAKSGAMPFHSWIPACAGPAPAPVMALLPASLDKLLGIYFLTRICLDLFIISPWAGYLLMTIGAITIIAAGAFALVQSDLKKLLSYSTISQVGYMVLGLGTGNPVGIVGGLFHMLNNAIYKSSLFLAAGSVEKQTGETDLEKLGGLGKYLPWTSFNFLIGALAIAGIPPLNGFVSKWLIYQGVVDSGLSGNYFYPIFLIAAVFGSALTLAYFIKVFYGVFLGSKPVKLAKPKEASWQMISPMLVLSGLCLILGVFAILALTNFFFPFTQGQILSSLGLVATATGFWNPLLALGLILLGMVLGAVLYLLGRVKLAKEAPIFAGGEQIAPEDIRVPGTDFYRTVSELPLLRTIYSDEEKGAYDIFNVGQKIGHVFTDILRRLHNGLLPNYLAWTIVGLFVLIIYLLVRI